VEARPASQSWPALVRILPRPVELADAVPFAAVRTASDPDMVLRTFFQQTFDAAAELGRWDMELRAPPTGPP
jgi:hypothetical protein